MDPTVLSNLETRLLGEGDLEIGPDEQGLAEVIGSETDSFFSELHENDGDLDSFFSELHENDGDLISVIDSDVEFYQGKFAGKPVGGPMMEMPTGPAYSKNLRFWKYVLSGMVFGGLLGLVSFGYLELIEKVQEKWFLKDGYGTEKDTVDAGTGDPMWIAIMGACGVLVGVIKVLVRFPEESHGLIHEVREEHVDPVQALKVVLVSLVSLCGGMSLGPEAAMGSLGGGLGQLWGEKWKMSEAERRMNVVNFMAGAMGSLFPSPVIAVLCMVEIGNPETMRNMKTVVTMSIAATASFAVYFFFKDSTYLPFNPISLLYEFKTFDNTKAAAIGILCGFLGFLHIIIAGIFKNLFTRIGDCLGRWPKLRGILIPTVGGLLCGAIAVWMPLTLGSGSKQTKDIFLLSISNEVDATVYFATAFAKSLTFGISKGSGFIGGAIFPMLFIGATLGAGMASWFNDHDALPKILSIACFSAGIPASVSPMPFTILLMLAFSMQLGAYQSTPIFISCIFAHLTTCGFGLLRSLLKVAQKRHIRRLRQQNLA